MGWIIRHNLVGNAQPLYMVEHSTGDLFGMTSSVRGVADITGLPTKRVRLACKEAREEGVSHYLE